MDQHATVTQTPDPKATVEHDDQFNMQPQSELSIPQANLRDQIEATSAYIRSSFRMSNASLPQSRLSLGLRSSLGSVSHGDANSLSSRLRNSEDMVISSDDEPADEKFVLDFAKQCAAYPGRKPLLVDIERSLTKAQQPQLPMILVLMLHVPHK